MDVGDPGSDHLTIPPVLSAPASGCMLIASGAELEPADYLHRVLPRRHFGRLATAAVKAIQTVKTRIRMSPASLGTL